MKQLQRLTVLFLPIMLLSACGQKQTVESSFTPPEISEAIISSQSELPPLGSILSGEDDFSFYLSNYYQIDNEQVEDGVIRFAEGVEASEIAILILTDESAVASARDALTAYMESRAGDFAGYAPAQQALAENGIVVINGRYAALLICADTEAAQTAFMNCFSSDGNVSRDYVQRLRHVECGKVYRLQLRSYDSPQQVQAIVAFSLCNAPGSHFNLLNDLKNLSFKCSPGFSPPPADPI